MPLASRLIYLFLGLGMVAAVGALLTAPPGAADAAGLDAQRVVPAGTAVGSPAADGPARPWLTGEQQAFLAEHPVIRVGVDAYWPPFQFVLNGEPTGYSIDLLQTLARRLGIELELVVRPSLSTLLSMLDQGKIDMLTSLYINEDRRSRFLFTQPYQSTHLALITRDEASAPKSLTDSSLQRVAMQRNDGAIELIQRLQPEASILGFEDELDALMAVAGGEVDAVIGAALPSLYLANTNHIVGLRVAEYLRDERTDPANTSLHFAVRPGWPLLRDSLDAALAELPPADLLALERRWFQDLVAVPSRPSSDLTLDERTFIQHLPALRVCTIPNWMPYSRINAAGQQQGLSADLSALLSQQLGLPVHLHATESWSESLQAIRDGRCDLLPIAMDVPSRRGYLDFSPPYSTQPFVIATRRIDPFINNLRALGQASIAVIEGYAQGELIESRYPDIRVHPVANAQEGLALVDRGIVAGYVDSLATIAYELRSGRSVDLKVAGMLPSGLELSVATRKETPLLGAAVIKALDAIGQEEIDHVVDRWLSAPYQPPPDRTWLAKLLVPIALGVLGLALWNRQLSRTNQQLAEARSKMAAQAIELERLARTDGLTQLGNRRRLDETLPQEMERCRRHRNPLAVLMLDLDHFKHINDRYGHLVGDRVLAELADLLRSMCRRIDTLIRWGGEEFLICCPQTDATAARAFAERLRLRIEAQPFERVGHLSASIGVSVLSETDSVEDLIGRADRMLYVAKRNGRNRVEMVDPLRGAS